MQDSLGGNSKTTIIANVSPSMDSAHETMSTLHFAARAKLMRNKARVNQDTRGNIDVLRREVLRLNRCALHTLHWLMGWGCKTVD